MAHLYGTVARCLRSEPEIDYVVWNGSIDGPNRVYLVVEADTPRPPSVAERTHGMSGHHRKGTSDLVSWHQRQRQDGRCQECGKESGGFARCALHRAKASAAKRRQRAAEHVA